MSQVSTRYYYTHLHSQKGEAKPPLSATDAKVAQAATRTFFDKTCFNWIQNSQLPLVAKFVIALGFDPNHMTDSETGETLLTEAVIDGNVELVEVLLSKTDPNMRNQGGLTPLMLAVKNQDPEMVALLLRQPNLNLEAEHEGYTAFEMAMEATPTPQMKRIIQSFLEQEAPEDRFLKELCEKSPTFNALYEQACSTRIHGKTAPWKFRFANYLPANANAACYHSHRVILIDVCHSPSNAKTISTLAFELTNAISFNRFGLIDHNLRARKYDDADGRNRYAEDLERVELEGVMLHQILMQEIGKELKATDAEQQRLQGVLSTFKGMNFDQAWESYWSYAQRSEHSNYYRETWDLFQKNKPLVK
jgi:hypothetical protein